MQADKQCLPSPNQCPNNNPNSVSCLIFEHTYCQTNANLQIWPKSCPLKFGEQCGIPFLYRFVRKTAKTCTTEIPLIFLPVRSTSRVQIQNQWQICKSAGAGARIISPVLENWDFPDSNLKWHSDVSLQRTPYSIHNA